MRIISQDRTMSYNFDDINLKIADTNICTTFGDKNIILGTYETGDRANKVFSEIHKVYVGLPLIQSRIEDEEIEKTIKSWSENTILNVRAITGNVENVGNIIYTMPEE